MRLAALCACLAMLCPRLAAAQESGFRRLRSGSASSAADVRLHFDLRALDSIRRSRRTNSTSAVSRLARGRIYDDLEYEVDVSALDSENPWRDVFLNYRKIRPIQVQGGKFKIPFGLDQLTSEFSNNFIERSLIGTQIAPGATRGSWSTAASRETGCGIRAAGSCTTATTRVRRGSRPERIPRGAAGGQHDCRTRGADALGADPRTAAAAAIRRDFTGAPSTTGCSGCGRTVREFTFFEPMYVSGERIRLVDALWTPGPFSVSAEYNRPRTKGTDRDWATSISLT